MDDFINKNNNHFIIKLPTLQKEFMACLKQVSLKACMFCVYGEINTNTNEYYKSIDNFHYGYYYNSDTMDIYRWGDKIPCSIYEIDINSQIIVEETEATQMVEVETLQNADEETSQMIEVEAKVITHTLYALNPYYYV